MAQKNPVLSYDKEARILSIRIAKTRSNDSEIYGNVVIDYAKNGEPVNIDIMDVSLSEFDPLRMHIKMPA